MKIKKPLVSVIIAVYNDIRYFPFSIDSILKQSYKNFEVLIVDDFSNNETREMLKIYCEKYPKIIKYIRSNRNLGDGERARNLAIPKARGKYIAVLDSDDIAYPNRLEKQVDFLERNNDVFLVGTQADTIDENGVSIGQRVLPLDPGSIRRIMYRKNAIINPSVMFRNEKKNSFYKIRFPIFNDYYTYACLISKGKKLCNLPDKLIKYRVSRSSATFSKVKYKFLINMDIKKALVQDFGYRPTLTDRIIVFFQYAFIMVFPEKITFGIYMLMPNK